jgi:ADP-heptose:LPS heptosyltransferase
MSQKQAKNFRKQLKNMKYELASDLKSAINALKFRQRVALAVKIIFKREW